MSKKVSDFESQLRDIVLSKTFFFKKPQNDKILIYTMFYILFVIVGSFLDLWLLSSLIITPMLTYLFGAKGLKIFIPLSATGIVFSWLIGGVYSSFWLFLHVFISLIVYLSLINRVAKLTMVAYISSFLFSSITIFVLVLIKSGYINFNPDSIQNFINSYVNSVVALQPEVDKNILLQNFEEIKLYFPTVIAISVVVHSLILAQYTLKFLGRNGVVIPVFPRLGTLAISKKITIAYIILLFLSFIAIIYYPNNEYNMVVIFLSNLVAITRWIFVLNGLNTVAFFISVMGKKLTTFFKILLFLAMYLFIPIFEMIGLVDSMFNLRERYIKMQGGK